MGKGVLLGGGSAGWPRDGRAARAAAFHERLLPVGSRYLQRYMERARGIRGLPRDHGSYILTHDMFNETFILESVHYLW